jgi:MoaA/NifB/PqqE/SkfB family radical SAM enzyme
MIGEAPQYVNWNFTYVCNLRCGHCYSRSPRYPRELDAAAYEQIARQIIDAGVLSVGFGGGEPTLREDLAYTIDCLSSEGIETQLTSNGWFLDAKQLQSLRVARLSRLLISLDGGTSDLNDELRSSPGSFDRALAAIRAASSAGIHTSISTVVSRRNFDSLAGIAAVAHAAGAKAMNLKLFRPSGSGKLRSSDYGLSEDQQLELSQCVHRLKDASPIEVNSFQGVEEARCSCGVTQITLRPNGDVTLCPYASSVIGNLTQVSLRELWLQNAVIAVRREQPSECLGIAAGNDAFPSNPQIPIAYLRSARS